MPISNAGGGCRESSLVADPRSEPQHKEVVRFHDELNGDLSMLIGADAEPETWIDDVDGSFGRDPMEATRSPRWARP